MIGKYAMCWQSPFDFLLILLWPLWTLVKLTLTTGEPQRGINDWFTYGLPNRSAPTGVKSPLNHRPHIRRRRRREPKRIRGLYPGEVDAKICHNTYPFTASTTENGDGVGITRFNLKPACSNSLANSASVRSAPPGRVSISRSSTLLG